MMAATISNNNNSSSTGINPTLSQSTTRARSTSSSSQIMMINNNNNNNNHNHNTNNSNNNNNNNSSNTNSNNSNNNSNHSSNSFFLVRLFRKFLRSLCFLFGAKKFFPSFPILLTLFALSIILQCILMFMIRWKNGSSTTMSTISPPMAPFSHFPSKSFCQQLHQQQQQQQQQSTTRKTSSSQQQQQQQLLLGSDGSGSDMSENYHQSDDDDEQNCCFSKQFVSIYIAQKHDFTLLTNNANQNNKKNDNDITNDQKTNDHAKNSPTTNSPTLPFTIEIKLLAYNRYDSIKRCLTSLREAIYSETDQVDLTIFLDHFPFKDHRDGDGNGEKTQNMMKNEENVDDETNEKLKLQYKILDMIHQFDWPHGRINVHVRQQNGNLQVAWLESFYPLDNDTYAFIVEDDIQVSPFYFMYLKKLIVKYRYPHLLASSSTSSKSTVLDPSVQQIVDKNIYGISFQRQHLVPGYWSGHSSVHVSNNDEQPYLYQLVGTWGQIVFPEHWREFRHYYDERFGVSEELKPNLGGMITDAWYQQKGEKIWTPWFIRFVYARNYYNLYTNFPDNKALSTSHRDSGENYKWFHSHLGADADIMTLKNTKDINLFLSHMDKELVDASQLKKFDYCLREIPRGRVIHLTASTTATTKTTATSTTEETNHDTAAQQQRQSPFSHHLKPEKNYLLIFTHWDQDEKQLRNQLCYLEQHASRSMESQLRHSILFATNHLESANQLAYRGYQAIYFDPKVHDEISVVRSVAHFLSPMSYLFISSTSHVLIKENPIPSGPLSIVRPGVNPEHNWIILHAETARMEVDTSRTAANHSPSSLPELIHLLNTPNRRISPSKLNGKFVTMLTKDNWSQVSVIRDDDMACLRIKCWR